MATDTLQIFGTQYTGVPGIKATDSNSQIKTYIRPQGTKSITSNGTSIDVTQYAAVDVAVPTSGGNVQSSKDYTVSASGSATISPDTGYDSMGEVALSVPAQILPTSTSGSATSGYTSKATISRSTSDQYINIPPGYNSAGGYYKISAVANMTLPTTASTTSSGTSKATIGRSTSNQYINIPVGYNSTAAYYTISAVANGSVTAPSQISGQALNANVTASRYDTTHNQVTFTETVANTPVVSTPGYITEGISGNSTLTLSALFNRADGDYYPSTTDQIISGGSYIMNGAYIKAVVVSGLDASKILSGTTVNIGDSADADRIISVSGSVTFKTYYTGSGAPSSSLGSVGDIYLQTS